MSDYNPYAPPEPVMPQPIGGNLHDAVAGNYQISILQVLRAGWVKAEGFKATFWLIFLTNLLVAGAVQYVTGKLGGLLGVKSDSYLAAEISMLISAAFTFLYVGWQVILVRRVAGQSYEIADLLAFWPQALGLGATFILFYVLVVLGFILLILPGIYLLVAYGFALVLKAEKNLSPWQALEISRRAVSHHWWRLFLFSVAVGFLVLLSFLTLGIALIWILPAVSLAWAELYVRIFGVSPQSETISA